MLNIPIDFWEFPVPSYGNHSYFDDIFSMMVFTGFQLPIINDKASRRHEIQACGSG